MHVILHFTPTHMVTNLCITWQDLSDDYTCQIWSLYIRQKFLDIVEVDNRFDMDALGSNKVKTWKYL